MTALRTWVHGSQSPGRPPYWGKVCSEALLPHRLLAHPHTLFFGLPRLYQGLSPVSSTLPEAKGKPLLFEKTTVTANQDRHKAREEAAMANQILMRTQLRGGDPRLAGQMQAGQPPPRRGGKDCCVAPRFQARLSPGQNTDGASPGQDLSSDHIHCYPPSPPVPILYNGLYSFQQTLSSCHWFSTAAGIQ